jgi:hypothetical protein
MSRRPLSLVALVISFAGGVASAFSATTIAIDGMHAGAIVSWEGGDLRASVVPGPTSTDGTATKQPGAAVYAPLVVQCAFLPTEPMRAWLVELCSNQTPRKKIVLTDYDGNGNATGATEFDGAMLVEVRLPAMDATSTASGDATFVFVVERSRQMALAPANASSTARTSGANFRLTLKDLDGSGVSRIESITIGRGAASTETVGATRDYTSTTGRIGYSNLTVTLLRAKSATWRAWFDDFVVNGNGSDTNEKSGALEFLSADLKQVVFALNIEHIGILRLSRVNVAAGAPGLDQAELYFEKISTGPSDESTADSETVQPLEAVLMQTDSLQMATGMLSDATTSTSGTTTVSVGDRFTSGDATVSDSTTAPTRAGTVVGTTSTAVTNTNPADQGSRDPAGFPRVEGLTRVDFSGQYHTTSTSEESHYTTPDKIYELLARIDAAAKGAGWTLAHFGEGYSQGEKWVAEQWKKDDSNVALSIYQPDTGITRYWIRVTTQIPEAN